MRLKPDEIKKLSNHLVNLMLANKDFTSRTPRPNLLNAVEAALTRHFDEERQIEDESQKLLNAQGGETMDRGKALLMIRKQVAKERDFVLSGAPDGRFSADKISHIAHLVADKIYDDDLADFADEDDGPKFVKKVFMDYFGRENEASEKARKKVMSLANAPFEGSREWDVLYRKYYEEELRRLGHS